MIWADLLELCCVRMPCREPCYAQNKGAFPFPKGTEGAAHLWWVISQAPNERGQWMKDQTFTGRGGEQRLTFFPGKDHNPILGKENWNSWAPRRKGWGRCMPKQRDLEMRNDRNGLAEPPSIMLQATDDISVGKSSVCRRNMWSHKSWLPNRLPSVRQGGFLSYCHDS